MAIKLIANYAKRLGLPGYSSHQFSVSIETELLRPDDVGAESARLYELLQTSVDEQIQQTGFVPDEAYGIAEQHPATNGNRLTKGATANGQWKCSDKQREFMLKLCDEHHLDRKQVDDLAQDLFDAPTVKLNKLQMSGLLDEVLARFCKPVRRNGRKAVHG